MEQNEEARKSVGVNAWGGEGGGWGGAGGGWMLVAAGALVLATYVPLTSDFQDTAPNLCWIPMAFIPV